MVHQSIIWFGCSAQDWLLQNTTRYRLSIFLWWTHCNFKANTKVYLRKNVIEILQGQRWPSGRTTLIDSLAKTGIAIEKNVGGVIFDCVSFLQRMFPLRRWERSAFVITMRLFCYSPLTHTVLLPSCCRVSIVTASRESRRIAVASGRLVCVWLYIDIKLQLTGYAGFCKNYGQCGTHVLFRISGSFIGYPVVTSCKRKMTVKFLSDSSVTNKGFVATYNTSTDFSMRMLSFRKGI